MLSTQSLPSANPELFVPQRVIVLRPFYVSGRRAEVGDTVTVPAHLAAELVAIGKARRAE